MPETARVRSESTDQRHESHLLAVRGDDTADDTAVAIASMHAMGSGTLADFQALYTADAVNREAKAEPPDTRGTGPAALYATARWLRTAFSELTWKVHDVAHDNDLVVIHATMSGRQTGPFVAYRPDAKVAAVFPPRGRTFTVTQTHWFRMYDGKVLSTGPTATTLAWANNSVGTHQHPCTWFGCCWPAAAPVAVDQPRPATNAKPAAPDPKANQHNDDAAAASVVERSTR